MILSNNLMENSNYAGLLFPSQFISVVIALL